MVRNLTRVLLFLALRKCFAAPLQTGRTAAAGHRIEPPLQYVKVVEGADEAFSGDTARMTESFGNAVGVDPRSYYALTGVRFFEPSFGGEALDVLDFRARAKAGATSRDIGSRDVTRRVKSRARSVLDAKNSPEIEDSPEARKSGLVPVVEIEDDGYDDALRFVGTDESWLIPRPPFIDVNTSVKTGILGHGATNESPTKAYAYCYPFTYDEVLDKCLAGALEQPGVIGLYLPLMMEIQQKHENVYYEKVAELRKRSDLEVVGIAYDNPRWDLIRDIVNEFPGTFSGVMVEWIGQWACVNQIFKPKPEHLDAVHANTTAGILRYFFRDQNLKLCMGNDHDDDNATVNQPIFLHPKNFATDDSFSPPEGLLPLPDFFEPVFACFGGNEGFCYRAFHEWPDKACSELQRFSFNPFELGGGRMMHLANETCHGLNGIDLYGTL